ncbi:MAG TPA: 50S ribosomal protein L1 [Candidatus Saccharimonadales bacterium]|nr:50S ribosomal protein L1 [Candidatus Saccharimonadales bacterium]
MAKTKVELLAEAKELGIEIDATAKVADIQAAIKAHGELVVEAAPAEESTEEETIVAKAGKRSAKALKETEERHAKEERKASGDTAPAKPKKPVKPTRSRLERRAKGYRKSAEQLEAGKNYSLKEAVALAKKTSHVKFDATVELHVNLNVDPKQADQNIRDTLVLPAGSGKTVKIAVFTDDAAAAKQTGANIAGTEELLALFDKGVTNFDVLIATPNLMAQLGKYARLLGPRGLMPNPKSGTVTTDVKKAVTEAKAGRVEYRVDSTGIVHLGVGKVSFAEAQLLDNLEAVLTNLRSNKPSGIKGAFIKAAYLTTSMGPSITLNLTDIS